MNENYELLEARGSNGQIEQAKIAIHFEDDGHTVTNFSSGKLSASIDADSDKDTIIHCALNAMGSKVLNDIRNDAKKKLEEEKLDNSEVYYLSENEEAPRPFVRLALVHLDLLKKLEDQVNIDELEPNERVLFEDAPTWRSDNVILNSVLTEDQIREVFILAKDLEKQSQHRDVFGITE